MTIAVIATCSFGSIMYYKIYIGTMHIHPPTEHDIEKIREEIKKNLRKHGNAEARRSADNDDLPFIRKTKKNPKNKKKLR